MGLRRWLGWWRAIARRLRSAGLGFWWLGAALALACAGQVALVGQQIPLGLILYTAAGVLFALLARRAGWAASVPAALAHGELRRRALPLTALAALLVGISCALVWQPTASLDERLAMLIFWLGGVLTFSGAVLRFSGWRMPGVREMAHGLRARRYEWGGLFLLGLLALLLRTIDLEQHPYAFANDEGWIGVEGWRILTGDLTHWFRVGWSAQPNLSFLPGALSIALFGKTIFAVRVVSAVEGTLTVIFTYLVGREAFGKRVGWGAALLLACMPVHIHFSRTAFNNILPGFFATLLVWLVLRALRRGEISAYLWAGLATGFALYSYLGSRLAMALAAGMLGYAVLFKRGYLRAHLIHLLVFAGAAALVMAPMMTYFIKVPDMFMTRLNTEGILQNGWLVKEMAAGRNAVEALLNQFSRSTLVFISQGGPGGFYGSPNAYLPAAAALFGMLGMAYSLSRARGLAHLTLQAWFWGLILTAGMLTTSPPQHQRMVMALPAAALLVGLGLEQAALMGARLRLGAPRLWQSLAGVVVAGTCLYGIVFYFGEYRLRGHYGDHSNEVTLESALLARQLDNTTWFISLGAPEIHLEFANFRYFLNDYMRMEYKTESGAQVAAAIGANTPAFFFAIPERRGDLEQVAAALPGGQWLDLKRKMKPDFPLLHAYITPAVSPPLQAPAPYSGGLDMGWIWLLGGAILLGGAGLTLWQLHRGTGKPVEARGPTRGAARLWRAANACYASPLPELAGLPEPDLELAWLKPLRQALAQLQTPQTPEGGQPREDESTPRPKMAQVELEVRLNAGQTLQIEIDADQPEATRITKK